MAREKRNIPEPEKKRRKAQALLENSDDFTPYAARALSRILRKLAEGPEDARNEILDLFDQIVNGVEVDCIFLGSNILTSVLYNLTCRAGDERAKTLYLFAQIIREK